jgi:hypothetical protein
MFTRQRIILGHLSDFCSLSGRFALRFETQLRRVDDERRIVDSRGVPSRCAMIRAALAVLGDTCERDVRIVEGVDES